MISLSGIFGKRVCYAEGSSKGTWFSSRLALGMAVSTFCGIAGTAFAADPLSTDPTHLPHTEVRGRRGLHDVTSESDLVGPAGQPEWTTRRIFAETDVYVIPPGEVEYNQFYISSHPREGKPGNLFESELEIGLPWRTQFDVEMNYSVQGGSIQYDSTMVELPHALADWGKIPLNPAIDAGWRFKVGEADAYFFRLLLAEDLGKSFQFGANLTYDHQVGGDQERGYELTTALNYGVIDGRFSVGVQCILEHETARESELDPVSGLYETEDVYSTAVLLGPTVLWRPSRSMHVGIAPLFGLTHDSPTVEALFLVGFDFEPFGSHASGESGRQGDVPMLRRHR